MTQFSRPQPETLLNLDGCIYYTEQYLQGQGWRLVDAETLAKRLWPELQGRNLVGRAAQEEVNTAVWQVYAMVVYDRCRRPDHPQHKDAWAELQAWLARRARTKIGHAQEREEVVQETMLRLHERFEKDSLQAPRALWGYALQALLRINISRSRARAAQKRGNDKAISLDEHEEGGHHSTDEQQRMGPDLPEQRLRPLEDKLIDRERRRQIDQFFERHLATELQLTVARAFFLENQTPAEIAGLLQKTPHEVRMIKARVVRTLRALPAAELKRLLQLLDAPPDDAPPDGGKEDHDPAP